MSDEHFFVVMERKKMKIKEYIATKYENGAFYIGEELVHCKECVERDKNGYCGITGGRMPDLHFCSYGERRNDETD